MRLILLRHGATDANTNRVYCGSTDLPLNETGREELLLLKARSAYPSIDNCLCITSGMKRTNETLGLLYGKQPDIEERAFREMDFGSFELHAYEELINRRDYIRWITDEDGLTETPGGECRKAFHDRVLDAFEEIRQDSLIVCHGGVIAAIMEHLFPKENKNMYKWQPKNGCGYEIWIEMCGARYVSVPSCEPKEG